MADPGTDPAAAALARARSLTRRGRGVAWRRQGSTYSSARPDDRDPQPLGRTMSGWVDSNGYSTDLAVAGLADRWPQIAGPAVAAHVTISSYAHEERRLVLQADSQEWAMQLRYLLRPLRERIDEELGRGLVTDIEVRGPGGVRKRGGWSVRTGRRSPRRAPDSAQGEE